MPKKKKMQDIVPPEKKRSVRDISVDKSSRKKKTTQKGEGEKEDTGEQNNTKKKPSLRGPRLPKSAQFGIWFIAALVLLVVGFAFFLFFSGATVNVTPKVTSATIDGTFTAGTAENSDISYETISLNATQTATVPTQGTETVEERAQGTLVVYNNYSEEPQRLVDNTRFQTAEGLVYRSTEAFVIPGRTTGEDGETQPGTVEVEVRAAEPGEEYNISSGTEFTIPGLSGTALFDSMWAQASTALSGGFSGTRKVISESDRETAQERLRDNLQSAFLEQAHQQIPDEFHLFDEATRVTVDGLTQVDSQEEDSARLEIEATFSGALFQKSALAKLVAQNALATYEGNPVTLKDFSAFSFSLSEPSTFTLSENAPFSFELSGSTDVIWTFDEEQLARDLAGKSESTLSQVLSGYPGIERAEAVLRPFWRTSFPAGAEDIQINTRTEGDAE